MASPLDHLGRAFAGALSAVAAVGDEARRRAEGARDAVVSTIAAVQQQRSNDVDASSAMHRQRRRRPFAGVAVRCFFVVLFLIISLEMRRERDVVMSHSIEKERVVPQKGLKIRLMMMKIWPPNQIVFDRKKKKKRRRPCSLSFSLSLSHASFSPPHPQS